MMNGCRTFWPTTVCDLIAFSGTYMILDGPPIKGLLVHADVPLPNGTQAPSEENDEMHEEDPHTGREPEKWLDLGLQFLH